jgi:hypothetical protein
MGHGDKNYDEDDEFALQEAKKEQKELEEEQFDLEAGDPSPLPPKRNHSYRDLPRTSSQGSMRGSGSGTMMDLDGLTTTGKIERIAQHTAENGAIGADGFGRKAVKKRMTAMLLEQNASDKNGFIRGGLANANSDDLGSPLHSPTGGEREMINPMNADKQPRPSRWTLLPDSLDLDDLPAEPTSPAAKAADKWFHKTQMHQAGVEEVDEGDEGDEGEEPKGNAQEAVTSPAFAGENPMVEAAAGTTGGSGAKDASAKKAGHIDPAVARNLGIFRNHNLKVDMGHSTRHRHEAHSHGASLDLGDSGKAVADSGTGIAGAAVPTLARANIATASFTITDGPLGIGISESQDPQYLMQFDYLTGKGDAEQLQSCGLQPLMVLQTLNGEDMAGVEYQTVRGGLKPRPITLVFTASEVNAKEGSIRKHPEPAPNAESEPAAPNAESKWEGVIDEGGGGNTYYWNMETGESSWELPAEGVHLGPTAPGLAAKPAEEEKEGTFVTTQKKLVVSDSSQWQAVDAGAGGVYYWNFATGETTWTMPAEGVHSAPHAPADGQSEKQRALSQGYAAVGVHVVDTAALAQQGKLRSAKTAKTLGDVAKKASTEDAAGGLPRGPEEDAAGRLSVKAMI